MKKKITVLYIDDERHNLYAFRAAFRLHFDILLAESAEEARDMLKKVEIPIIVADQRMPVETGIMFFESIKHLYPNTLRILLTGYTDIEAVINAVNIGNIFRYIQKPWKEAEIIEAIYSAFEVYDSRVQLIEKNKALEKAHQELDRFVYSASHDMRFPLMSILGIVRLARMENDLKHIQQYFEMIETSVERLDVFIKNIINYYKNNRINLDPQPIDFHKVVEECLAEDIFKKEIIAHASVEAEPEVVFKTDLLKLTIILANLLSNGIRYQDPQKTEKRLYLNVVVTNEKAIITVRDNGIGIKESDLDNIFKMFYRATNQNPGSGLGLYITKEAVQHLGGNIIVQSALHEGTAFQITIPNLS
jgi:two-component system, sensor histidine kinase and response regulator